MKLALVIHEGPQQYQASQSAYSFCSAALAQGHAIVRVFFYGAGVLNASLWARPPQDETHLVQRWSQLAQQFNVDLVVCVAAAQRRGLQPEHIAPGFRISGLGQLVDASIAADRVVVFGR